MKFKKGDLVKILSGRDKGKSGNVELINKAKNKAVVKSINIVKRHYKPQKNSAKQGIIEKPMPINISNIGLICQNCQKVTRIQFRVTKEEKNRICSKCNEVIQ